MAAIVRAQVWFWRQFLAEVCTDDFSMIVTALSLGVCIGLLMGLTGAGGGVLAVPALMMGLGLSLPQASPIALTAVAIAAATGGLHGLRAGTVRPRAALIMATCGSLTAPLGSWLAQRSAPQTLNTLFIFIMLLVAWRMFGQSRAASAHISDDTLPAKPCRLSRETGRFIWNRKSVPIVGGIGATAGLFNGLLGVGGGFFIVPALSYVSDAGLHSIIATSLMVIALISTLSVSIAAASGTLVFTAAAWYFIAAVVVGMMLGRKISPLVPVVVLQRGFAALCIAAAGGMAWRMLG